MTALHIEVISPGDLEPRQARVWSALQATQPALRSPFYALGFMQAVATHRNDLRLCIFTRNGAITGFLPFHQRGWGRAAPLAAPISDAQGVIGEAPAEAELARMLRDCGLACFDYDHAPGDAQLFDAHAFRRTNSPLIDLRAGYDEWRAAKRASGSALKTVERKMRKIERELGPLRFVANDRSDEAWATFLDWKRASLTAIGARFILDRPWARAVIEEVRGVETTRFAGLFSTIYAGDRLVAAHFGMRSESTWHWWFPSYDMDLSPYSPGLILLLRCARHADTIGLIEIDLGRGAERYKQEFSNNARSLCEGSLERAGTWQGIARRFRKELHRHTENRLPAPIVDVNRRVFDRLLQAGCV